MKNLDSRTTLVEATRNGQEALVRLLLEKDANIEAKDKYKRMALFKATMDGNEAVVLLLLEKGARANAKDEYRWTAE